MTHHSRPLLPPPIGRRARWHAARWVLALAWTCLAPLWSVPAGAQDAVVPQAQPPAQTTPPAQTPPAAA
ncbi:MAG: hypothetical protein ACKOFW_06995, partial [Planctomycetaceae bacterium]